MASIKHFTELIAWQKAHGYVLTAYKLSNQFPGSENFGLSSQLQRSVVSVTSNIAEGFDRGSRTEFKHFLIMVRASLSESQNQLIIAKDLKYISVSDYEIAKEESVVVHKIINALIKSILLTNSKSLKHTNLSGGY